ncbi:MAG: methyl-accepting chemotaxis protein, partial [Clostridia bacterium]|nr:methyl-accepting chemotaxis protein [Clostridia bacterium]
ENLKKIAEGDLSVEIIKKSEDDVLADSMQIVVDNLNDLNTEVNGLTESVMSGNLSKKLDSQLRGKYREIVQGVTYIQDAFVNVLDNINVGILIVDKEMNLSFCNKFVFGAFGEERENLLGKKCNDLFECKDECMHEECIKNKSTYVMEGITLDKHYKTDISPYNDRSGNLRGIIEVAMDITEIKTAEKVAKKQLDYQEGEINKVIENLNNLANGNLNIHPTVSEPDADTKAIAENFKKLNDSLEESASSMKSMIEEVSEMLVEMSNKNLSQKIVRDYMGDFIKLKDSINHIVEQFNVILTEINTAAEQVEVGAEQVASSSQNLSQGASEQASSVEEIGATVTEVADQTSENAKNADEANELSMKAKSGAQMGNDQMKEMLLAMDDIKDSSKNISNIIKVIDEIAFQTNILALNAAVEAARAGEHGKGFAVVAEEVRNLAARSAKAAKETTDLIDNSISKVDEGYKIANDTAEALNKIVDGVTDTVEIVGKIAQASNQQATAISEINRGIEQISGVTQTNTSTAEESASASEEMAAQAQTLKAMIQEFELSSDLNRKDTQVASIASKNTDKRLLNDVTDINLGDNSFGKY